LTIRSRVKEKKQEKRSKSPKKPKDLYIPISLLGINLYTKGIKMSQTAILEREKAMHSPTLNTVLMVEDVLKEAGELVKLSELKKRLPRKVMHQTLLQILDYLQYSGKIVIGTKGILWVYAGRKELNDLIKRGTEI